ncbi:hypothetical protein HDU85_002331 [Gaertneriomyces sp. JEL0708]|nr:hypothetical protein HDU85_002331 [Gaertneriomyces sp. JEL0708]
MQSLLLQQHNQENIFDEDVLDDVEDFNVGEEEQDVFEDDFGTTDEDDEPADEEAQLLQAEKAEKRRARRKTAQILPTAKQKSTTVSKTGRPEISAATGRTRRSSSKPVEVTKSVAAGTKRKRLDALGPSFHHGVRQSSRPQALQSKLALQEKLSLTEQRKAMLPQRHRTAEVEVTQEERLEEAQETERMNLESLQNILAIEEENRRKKNVKREGLTGPVIRWRSVKEIDASAPPDLVSLAEDDTRANPPDSHIIEDDQMASTQGPKFVARNYLIFENFEVDPLKEWSQPPERPKKAKCPITGLPARFRDPTTQIPYANKEAFLTIQQLQRNEYAWSPILGTFIQSFTETVEGVPEHWEEACVGRPLPEEEKKEAVNVADESEDDEGRKAQQSGTVEDKNSNNTAATGTPSASDLPKDSVGKQPSETATKTASSKKASAHEQGAKKARPTPKTKSKPKNRSAGASPQAALQDNHVSLLLNGALPFPNVSSGAPHPVANPYMPPSTSTASVASTRSFIAQTVLQNLPPNPYLAAQLSSIPGLYSPSSPLTATAISSLTPYFRPPNDAGGLPSPGSVTRMLPANYQASLTTAKWTAPLPATTVGRPQMVAFPAAPGTPAAPLPSAPPTLTTPLMMSATPWIPAPSMLPASSITPAQLAVLAEMTASQREQLLSAFTGQSARQTLTPTVVRQPPQQSTAVAQLTAALSSHAQPAQNDTTSEKPVDSNAAGQTESK